MLLPPVLALFAVMRMTGVILMLGRLARRHACNAHALQGGFQSALVDLFALELQVHRTGRASASFQYAKHRAHLFGHVAGASLMPDAGDRPGHGPHVAH